MSFFRRSAETSRPSPRTQESFPTAELREGLLHTLRLLQRAIAYHGGDPTFRRKSGRLVLEVERARYATDFQTIGVELLDLTLPFAHAHLPERSEVVHVLRMCIESTKKIANALNGQSAETVFNRLQIDLEEPDAEISVPQRYTRQVEALAESVNWLRQTADVFRYALHDIVSALRPLATTHEFPVSRLERIAAEVRESEEIEQLERLRQKLLSEATLLVDYAKHRSDQASQIAEIAKLANEEAKRLERVLRNAESMARNDSLTGLPNCLAMHEYATQLANDPDWTSALTIEVGKTEPMERSQGAEKRDKLIRRIAQVINTELTRKNSDGRNRAFRTSEREFVLLLPRTTSGQAVHIASVLRGRVEDAISEFICDERELQPSVSIGISNWKEGEPISAALSRAKESRKEI
ncbi:MAG: diguanylate cyclase [Myxococcota bacterium]